MKCRFKRTGAIVEVAVPIRGEEWELVNEAPVQSAEKEQNPKRKARKKASDGDELRNNR